MNDQMPEEEAAESADETIPENWYLIHTKPKQELVAHANLENQDFPVYMPMTQVRKRVKGNPVLVSEVMFPRYIFIALNTVVDNWYPIRSTRGVHELVRFGMEPGRVPLSFIQLLKQKENQAEETAELNAFDKGDRILIKEGPMAGYEGIFDKKSGDKRALVLLEFAGKYTKVQMELDGIDKIVE